MYEHLFTSENISVESTCEYKHAGLYVDESIYVPNQQALRTKEFIPAQTVLSIQQCALSTHRTRTSIQVTELFHAEADDCIRFANHSCQPNAAVISKYIDGAAYVTILLVSVRDIIGGDEIQFDYASTETTLTKGLLFAPCLCNSPLCRKVLTGFSELTPTQKDQVAATLPVASHILKLYV